MSASSDTPLQTGLPAAKLRAEILEIAQNCPVDACNAEDCPLFQVRQLPPDQRGQWIDSLTQADLEYLTAYHHVCLRLIFQAHAPKSV